MKKKRKLNKNGKFALAILILLVIIVSGVLFFNYMTSGTGSMNETVTITVAKGDTYSSLASELKKQDLIRSEMFYKLFLKLKSPTGLKEGNYTLNKSMNLDQIITSLSGDELYESNVVRITFKEGRNMRWYAHQIAESTNHTEQELYALLKDDGYLTELISKYWFLTDEIKNKEIYYSLEGYLYPDTYEFANKDVPLKDLLEKILDNTARKLEPYRAQLENSPYTIHQLLTLSSIIELEAAHSDDRAGVAGVFYNRLEGGWALGSDVTTYYAVQVDLDERDLYQSELDDYNAYNTRSSKMAGKLPVGPICNPSIVAIEATLNPKTHNYLYFVADKNKKTYFSTTAKEHDKTIQKLKAQGLWYTY